MALSLSQMSGGLAAERRKPPGFLRYSFINVPDGLRRSATKASGIEREPAACRSPSTGSDGSAVLLFRTPRLLFEYQLAFNRSAQGAMSVRPQIYSSRIELGSD